MIHQENEIKHSFKAWLTEIGSLSDKSWHALSELIHIRDVARNTCILDHNNENKHFLFIYSGIVKSEFHENGTSYVNDFHIGPSVCSRTLSHITTSMNNKISLTTIISSILIEIKKTEIIKILPQHVDLQHASLVITNSYTSRMLNQMQRIRLLKSDESYQFVIENCPAVAEHAKQTDIASYLNITPTSLSRSKRMMLNE